mmetsp:Transcript_43166/g.102718  ORF Transcript_43166/g.102718 Transcript_43166/m.102718 type:complete len:167 (-) Transcript_43166:408-908(-)
MGIIHGMQAFVPEMEAEGGEKHIVNTASAAGLYSQHRATMAPYVASKHCAFVACQALNTELTLRGSNVQAHVLCPSIVASNLVNTSRYFLSQHAEVGGEPDETSRKFDQRLNSEGMSAAQVADLTFAGIEAGNFLIVTHPKITRERVDARHAEIVHAINLQPQSGF